MGVDIVLLGTLGTEILCEQLREQQQCLVVFLHVLLTASESGLNKSRTASFNAVFVGNLAQDAAKAEGPTVVGTSWTETEKTVSFKEGFQKGSFHQDKRVSLDFAKIF